MAYLAQSRAGADVLLQQVTQKVCSFGDYVLIDIVRLRHRIKHDHALRMVLRVRVSHCNAHLYQSHCSNQATRCYVLQ